MTVWVVDSNAFIHLGAIASEDAVTSFRNSLSKHGGMIHVTSGVHDEVKPSDSGHGGKDLES